jgi:hypothetical protein
LADSLTLVNATFALARGQVCGGAGERANGRGQAGKWGNKGLALAVVKFPSLMPERSLMIATRQSMVAPCNFWNVIANAAWTSKTFARMGLASTSAPSALVRCSGARLKNACQCGISGSVLGGALIYGAASMEKGGGVSPPWGLSKTWREMARPRSTHRGLAPSPRQAGI